MQLTHEAGELVTIRSHVYLTGKGKARLAQAGIDTWTWLVEYRKGLNDAEAEIENEEHDDREADA